MYPSKKDPVYGTFVYSFVEQMSVLNAGGVTRKIVLCGRDGGILAKILKYMKFYTSVLFALLFRHYDLIYVHTISYTILPIKLVSKWKRLPLVFNVHGGDVLTRSALAAKLKSQACPLVEQAKMIVSPSHFFKQILLREFKGLSAERIYVSPSGGVGNEFYLSDIRKKNDVLTIGYVSRISEAKGWDVLLLAVRKLVDDGVNCRLIVAGRGEQQEDFLKMVRSLSLSEVVSYLGPIPYYSLPRIYQQMDLFIFPTCLEESLGLVGLEAMASKLPVIGSHIGGLTDYIQDGVNGFFFTPGNVEELVQKIKCYKSLPCEVQKQMAEQAYHTATSYKAEDVGYNLYKKMCLMSEEYKVSSDK